MNVKTHVELIDNFIDEWTNSDCQIIYGEIEWELTINNMFDIIRFQ